MVEVQEFTGHADLYVLARNKATGPADSQILLRDAHGTSRAVQLNRYIRQWWGYWTGTYQFCFYATTPYSAIVKVTEFDYSGSFDFLSGQIQTVRVRGQGSSQGRFSSPDMTKDSLLYIFAEGQGFQKDQEPPKVFYKICNGAYADCIVNIARDFAGQGMQEVGEPSPI